MKTLSLTQLLPARRATASTTTMDQPKSRAAGNRLLFYLFLGNLSILTVGMGVFPLLPVYAADFGASPTLVASHWR